MLKALPWDVIGPAAGVLIVVLVIIFGFMLKWQKGTRVPTTPTNPPKDINTTGKKTLCFQHEGKIAGNQKAIEIFGGALQEANRNNSEQHGKIFDKIEAQGKEIITEIHKANAKT